VGNSFEKTYGFLKSSIVSKLIVAASLKKRGQLSLLFVGKCRPAFWRSCRAKPWAIKVRRRRKEAGRQGTSGELRKKDGNAKMVQI
jgi:hypothetical protein